ncbi:MAG TPA: aryl-sulfate sulfotransferase, partial [Chthoniobacterales bacterium]|nr:aryl-sulfate sulfotransferase [Chthoniobacterales bacterium]
TLIASARELFVIAVDYDTKQIKWILGHTTKHWYVNFQSLRPYTLNAPGNVPPNTLAPIGQHTVSVTHDDKLLLFDNGVNSLTASNNPPGLSRTYSAPRKYDINLQTKRATEMWNYESGQTLNSPFCSSVYEDGPLSYLIDYSFVDNLSPGGNPLYCVLIGLNPAGAKVFDYRHTTNGCDFAWNAMPVHLEHLVFAGAATNAVKIASIAKGAVSCTVNFAAIAGGHYRLEYKNNLSDASWSPLTDYIAECTSSASITDLTIGSQTQRFYRVVRLSS